MQAAIKKTNISKTEIRQRIKYLTGSAQIEPGETCMIEITHGKDIIDIPFVLVDYVVPNVNIKCAHILSTIEKSTFQFYYKPYITNATDVKEKELVVINLMLVPKNLIS